MGYEIAGDNGRRPISHTALKDAIFDALSSEFMFDTLHAGGAIPDPDIAVLRVSEEVCVGLERAFKREHLDLSIRRNVPYRELGIEDHSGSKTSRRKESSQAAASIVTFDAAGHPLHVLEIVAQWDHAACLELVHGLAGLLRANRISDASPTTVQWAGLACYHSHRGDPQTRPWFDLDGGPSLEDEIEAAIKAEFRKSFPSSEGAVKPKAETFAFDRFGKPPYGNGAVTVALIELNAFSEDAESSSG
jgi:hypothetical protein